MKYLLYTLSFVLLFSCSEEQEIIPDHIIQPNKMSDVLLDIQLMNSHLDQERIMNPYILDSTNAYYNAVYSKHDISKTDFDSSISFYSNNIVLLDSIYSSVFTKLKTLELELKDVKSNSPNMKYLTRDELIINLKKLGFQMFLTRKFVDFVAARDSIDNFIIHNKVQLDSINITPAQLKNSFAIYGNSRKRMKQLKEDLK